MTAIVDYLAARK